MQMVRLKTSRLFLQQQITLNKDIQIISSTTDYTEFNEEIKKAVSRWKFPKVKSGETIATFPITFLEKPIEKKTTQSE